MLAVIAVRLPFIAGGCTWQANNASQAVDINPFAIGSGEQVVSPANSFGYVNGVPQDMRNRH